MSAVRHELGPVAIRILHHPDALTGSRLTGGDDHLVAGIGRGREGLLRREQVGEVRWDGAVFGESHGAATGVAGVALDERAGAGDDQSDHLPDDLPAIALPPGDSEHCGVDPSVGPRHVLEYLRSSAWSFFAEGDPAAEGPGLPTKLWTLFARQEGVAVQEFDVERGD